MADITISEFPQAYLEALDEVLTTSSFSNVYDDGAAEFVTSKTVRVPKLSFQSSPVDYDRFATQGKATLDYETFELAFDKQETFYIDAVEDIDTAGILTTNLVAEYIRTVLNPFIDKSFFAKALEKAEGKGTTDLTTTNIKEEIRKGRAQFTEHGLMGGNLYMTSSALACLEDATMRQWSNDTSITDTVGTYDGFQIYTVPDDTLGCDFIMISGGKDTIRHITKRAVTYTFAPGQHTQGDGWLTQMRWLYDDIVYDNKTPGIYTNKGTSSPVAGVALVVNKVKV